MPSSLQHRDGLHRERFVQLEQVDVSSAQPTFVETRRTASTGVISRYFGASPLVAWPTMRAIGASPSSAARVADITTSAAAPSLTGGALPAVTVPSLLERGPQRAQRLQPIVSARTDSSRSTTSGPPFFCGICNRQDLGLEAAGRLCVRAAFAVALGRVLVLLRRGRCGTRWPRPRRPLPMWHCSNEHHRPSRIIESSSSRWPMRSALAHAGQQVGRVAHRLHAAGDGDLDVAGRDPLRREHHRLQSRPADLVDRQRGDVVGQPAAQRRLTRRRLAEPGRHDVAHDAFVDARRIDAGARARLRARQGRRARSLRVLQGPEELAGRRSNGR